MSNTKILSKKNILSAGLFDVDEFIVEKDGQQHIHKNAHEKDIVMIFPMTGEQEVFFVSQYRYLHNKVLTEAVAGFVNDNEEFLDAAKRELKEETGILAKEWQHLMTINRGGSVITGKIHLYLARELTNGEQELDGFEEIVVLKMPFAEAVNKVLTGQINTSATMVGVLLIDKLLNEGKL